MPHNNPGYDIESRRPDGHIVFIEVKGRVAGAEEFWVTRTEALHGKNSATGSRLAMVSVHPAGPESDAVRYIVDPFRDMPERLTAAVTTRNRPVKQSRARTHQIVESERMIRAGAASQMSVQIVQF